MQQIINEVRERAKQNIDKEIPLQYFKMSMNRDFIFSSPDHIPVKVALSSVAESQIFNRLKIPAPYLRRCSDGLAAINFNYWTEKTGSKVLVRYRNELIRAIFSTHYTPIDDIFLYPIIEEATREYRKNTETHQQDSDISELIIPVNLTDQENKFHGQISVINSETGQSAVWILPSFSERNNLSYYASSGARFIHRGEITTENIREAVAEAYKRIQIGITQALILEQKEINPQKCIERLQEEDILAVSLLETLKEEYQRVERDTELNFIRSILEKVSHFPLIERLQLNRQVSQHFDLFPESLDGIL